MTEAFLSSAGTRYQLLCVAYTKYALDTLQLGQAEQLELVEDLVKLQTGDVTSETIKAITTCDHATARTIEAAMDMGPKHLWQKGNRDGIEIHMSEGFDVLTGRAWPDLCRVNPSLDRALKLCRGHYVQEAA